MPRDYTDTVRDLHRLIDEEVTDGQRKREARNDLDVLLRDFRQLNEQVTQLRIQAGRDVDEHKAREIAKQEIASLETTVGWHTWLLRGVIVATVLEIVAGVVVAIIVHSLTGKVG